MYVHRFKKRKLENSEQNYFSTKVFAIFLEC